MTGIESFGSTKRSLLALSHAMERSIQVAATPGGGPRHSLLIAMFQRREYFEPERERYSRIAERGTLCIVGFVGEDLSMAAGVNLVPLDPGEDLAATWALIAIDGSLGTALVAADVHDVAEGEATLEAARLYEARWTFSPGEAAREGEAILAAVRERLEPRVWAAASDVLARAAQARPSEAERRLTAVAESLVTSIDKAQVRSMRLNSQLHRAQERSETDPLTGLHNRRYLDRYLRTPATVAPLCVATLLVDIDGLKGINDVEGHSAGDAAITMVADVLMSETRPQDVVVRLGGDEFIVALPGLDPSAAQAVGERIVSSIGSLRLPAPWDGVTVSVSVGVAMAEPNEIPMESLDSALYHVKRHGKGGVHLASQSA